jgi:DNA-binding NarL/FixJ family response regulator
MQRLCILDQACPGQQHCPAVSGVTVWPEGQAANTSIPTIESIEAPPRVDPHLPRQGVDSIGAKSGHHHERKYSGRMGPSTTRVCHPMLSSRGKDQPSSRPGAVASRRVLVIDDHPISRTGLVTVLRRVPQVSEVLEAGSLAEGRHAWTRQPLDLVMLDLSLPDGDGFALLEEARDLGLPGAVVVISMHDDKGYRLRSQALGAVAFVCKSVPSSEVSGLVEGILLGSRAFTALPGRPVSGSVTASPSLTTRLETLTEAERRVLGLLGRNLTSREIARVLDVSHRTVENHRANICRKLELRGPHRLLEVALSLAS